MSNLMINASLQKTMSSREIAGVAGASHDNVLKTVRGLIDKGVVFGNETTYRHPQNGQSYPEFLLSFRDTMVVISGYNADLRAKIIDRWQELESSLAPQIPTTLSGALRLAADQAEQIERQQRELADAQPAIQFLDKFVEAKSTRSLREVAKVLGVKERQFITRMEDERILFRQSGNLLPVALYHHKGYFEVKTGESNGHAFQQTRFTPEGIAWISRRFGLIQEAA